MDGTLVVLKKFVLGFMMDKKKLFDSLNVHLGADEAGLSASM